LSISSLKASRRSQDDTADVTVLGLPYDTAIDIWSIGCTLYELYTGKILFPGRSNNHMLRLMMEVKGKFNHRLIKKASFGEMYFDENINFLSVEKDKITGSVSAYLIAMYHRLGLSWERVVGDQPQGSKHHR
jgi:serine/threonine protein kinase